MTLGYLATPYTKFEDGLDAAFIAACQLGARLLKAGLFVYSPIVHLHPMAREGRLDPLDLDLFYPHNTVMMERCDALLIAHLPGWEQSAGIAMEIDFFAGHDKPIFDVEPINLVMTRRSASADERMSLTLADMRSRHGGKPASVLPLALPGRV